jgi:hypothetical protein
LAESASYFRLAAGFHHEVDRNDDEGLSESGASLNSAVARALSERSVFNRFGSTLDLVGRWLEFGIYAKTDVPLAAECDSAAAIRGNAEP